jgi:hypothetical protein
MEIELSKEEQAALAGELAPAQRDQSEAASSLRGEVANAKGSGRQAGHAPDLTGESLDELEAESLPRSTGPSVSTSQASSRHASPSLGHTYALDASMSASHSRSVSLSSSAGGERELDLKGDGWVGTASTSKSRRGSAGAAELYIHEKHPTPAVAWTAPPRGPHVHTLAIPASPLASPFAAGHGALPTTFPALPLPPDDFDTLPGAAGLASPARKGARKGQLPPLRKQ